MHVVLIETSSNQRYIFATNKLRENVGASELTYRVGTRTVLKAVENITNTGKQIYHDDVNVLRRNLLDEKANPHIGNGNKVEVIVATSGKAILLVDDDEHRTISKQIIREVTRTALREMPGLTVHGAISEISFDTIEEKNAEGKFKLHEAIGEVHRKLERLRHEMPGNEQRFQRLPFVAPCATSGLPASEIIEFRNEQGRDVFAFSRLTIAKRQLLAKEKGKLADKHKFDKGRIVNLLEKTFALTLPTDLAKFELAFPDTDWLAVIHADGNGLGEIFLAFDEYVKNKGGREYIETYRKFSLALDVCTINAAGYALKKLQSCFYEGTTVVPVVPLVLGGDDLTVLCSGRFALKFTKDFLTQFEKETSMLSKTLCIDGETIELNSLDVIEKLQGVIPKIANNAFGNKDDDNPSVHRLGICAGVAIVKPHFPFHQAYELAEQLLRSAKHVKEKIKHVAKVRTDSGEEEKKVQLPSSALDFHILYDSAHSDLKDIRAKLTTDSGETELFAKPYIVTDEKELLGADDESKRWAEHRYFSELGRRVNAMHAKDKDGRRKLPNTQLHSLREALFLGRKETDARVNLIAHRYEAESKGAEKNFRQLFVKDTDRLFFDEMRKDNGKEYEVHATHFMDALDVVEFWQGFPAARQSNGTEKQDDE